MSKPILAFDLGTKAAGCVELVGDSIAFHQQWLWTGPRKAPVIERQRSLFKWIVWQVCYGPLSAPVSAHIVAVEAAHLLPNRPRAVAVLAECIGGLIALMPTTNEIVKVQPSQAKGALVGKGNASKAEMVQWAFLRFGERLSEHEADALGVALAALAQLKEKELINGP